MEEFEKIRLSVGNNIITDNNYDVFRVEDGIVQVYIVSFYGKGTGRRVPLYKAKRGELIPSFSYTDVENLDLRFCLSSENACVSLMQNYSTGVLRARFAEKAGITNFGIESYNEALAEKYRLLNVNDDGGLKLRRQNEQKVSDGIIKEITDAFSNKKKPISNTDNPLYNALALICQYSDIDLVPYSEVMNTGYVNPQVDDIALLSNFAYREIKLADNWYNQNFGALLVFDENGTAMACLPKGRRSYTLHTETGIEKLGKSTASRLRSRAYVFYRPLPQKKLSKRDIHKFWLKSLRITEILWFFIVSMLSTLTAVSIPTISRELYNLYIPLGVESILYELGAMLFGLMAANVVFSIVRRLTIYRQSLLVGYDFQSAVIHRLFTLPQSFFGRYDSSELAVGVSASASALGTIIGESISLVMSIFISAVYLACMLFISPMMSIWGLTALLIYSAIYPILIRYCAKYSRKYVDANAKSTAVLTRMIFNIEKIKTSSSEKRAFLQYLKPHLKERNIEKKTKRIRSNLFTLSLASSGIFSMFFYLIVYAHGFAVSAGEFIAFFSLFGGLCGFVTASINSVVAIKSEKPMLRRLKPIFDEEPESSHAKHTLNGFRHEIRLENLSFSYGSTPILKNINLTIKKGEYVAFTGVSGSGKSTLIKLLLGFGKPSGGKVIYDGYDLEELNKKLFRKCIGTVLQDSNLIAGSIYDNITVSRPDASTAEINAAVKLAALEDDIKNMPMGLHTVLCEENSSVSEGQKQRILIARAIISNPDIIILDEATSALDNISQKVVTDNLRQSPATKIVVAHRLSTVMKCDRIIVIDDGRVVEQGSPDELINSGGFFTDLAERQKEGKE